MGQNAREEVNVIVKGGNYGWRCYEGNRSFKLSGCQDVSSYRFPVVDHEHPTASSLTGGFVYRGNDQPGLRGIYIYADFGTGRMWGINSASQTPLPAHLLDSGISPSSFGESESGELYVLDYYPGNVYRVDQTN